MELLDATSPNLLPFDGEVFYYPLFFSSQQCNQFLSALMNEIDWKQEPIRIFGKMVMQPRLTAWYGEKSYSYSGITLHPTPWNATLAAIKQQVEAVAGIQFTSALLNFYRDGRDSMGWHRDNEKELGNEPVIASVSFGGVRKFQMRHYRDKNNLKNFELGDGSLLIMKGKTQENWEHCLPKTAKPIAPRINITFRVIF